MADSRPVEEPTADRLTARERVVSPSPIHVVDGLHRYRFLVLVLLSCLYLAATCFRASRKLFWFDELFTVYISRLPDMASVWSALKHGADLNPPLFYGLVRLSESLFGEGQVGTRMPEIIAFWICCLCLFRFVSSRTSVLAGLISMLFPLVTTAYFYAYEARPHGIVLGCGGIALVCWQSATRSKPRTWWLIGLFASLFCAILNHTYAVLLLVPLGLAEFSRSVLLKRVDWMVWLAMVCPLSGVLLYVPLFRVVKSGIGQVAGPSLRTLADSYQFHLGPSAGVLSAALILSFFFTFGWPNRRAPSSLLPKHSLGLPEVIALVSFVAMPVFCFVIAKILGVPLYSRYGISIVIGFGGLFGIVTAQQRVVGWGVLCVLIAQIFINFYQYAKSDSISEPSVSLALSTRSSRFGLIYQTMEALPDKSSPIVLWGNDHEFLPIMHYAPASLASRLVYVMRAGNDPNGEGCVILRRLCNFPGRCEDMADFLAAHNRFFARGNSDPFDRISSIIRAGADVRMESILDDSYLVSVTMK
jgi:hypothetical protein